jgi:tetratricopeptide (TPR) repeat protein
MYAQLTVRGMVGTACLILLACGDQPAVQLPPFLPAVPEGAEAISLRGDTLAPPPLTGEAAAQRTAELEQARAAWEAHPEDADSIIWYGRRLAYVGRYREAVGAFTRGIERHPNDARLYRHRGHRLVTLRLLDRAVGDLTKAAELVAGEPDEIEPDGLPNAAGIPLSTLHFNIWYHLGLAHYLRGDFPRAEAAYSSCLEVSRNPDLQVATRYWLYLTLRRQGKADAARKLLNGVTPTMEIIENDSYHRLLLLFKGDLAADSVLAAGADDALQNATVGYGVARWYADQGRDGDAGATIERVLAGSQWAAFGYIAAEADAAPGN